MKNDKHTPTDVEFLRGGAHSGGARTGMGHHDDNVSTKNHAVVSWPVFLIIAIPIVIGMALIWTSF